MSRRTLFFSCCFVLEGRARRGHDGVDEVELRCAAVLLAAARLLRGLAHEPPEPPALAALHQT